MADVWSTLEERTRAWPALSRQALADAIWQDHVLARFAGSADPRALPYLYPYLRSPDRSTRLRAIATAARVFRGGGRSAIGRLEWFTANPDHFIRDRAVQVVAATMRGSQPTEVLEVLRPYLAHPNHFVRREAAAAAAHALNGCALPEAAAELERTCASAGSALAPELLALVFAGRPDAAVWPQLAAHPTALGILVHRADPAWFERALADCFAPALADIHRFFRQREAVVALCFGGAGLGMAALRPALASAGKRHTGHALLAAVLQLFDGVDEAAERGPLIELARQGATPQRRVAAICLGRMLLGSGDPEAVQVLRDGIGARDGAVRSAMLQGLGLAARSSREGELITLCAAHLRDGQTTVAALRAISLLALGTGDPAADALMRRELAWHRAQPRAGHAHSRALAACHWALGLVHLGTGSLEAIDPLIETLALPDTLANREYRRAAAKALALIEHGEPTLALGAVESDGVYDGHWTSGLPGPWSGILTSLEP
jgi:HEAT repeat protein